MVVIAGKIVQQRKYLWPEVMVAVYNSLTGREKQANMKICREERERMKLAQGVAGGRQSPILPN